MSKAAILKATRLMDSGRWGEARDVLGDALAPAGTPSNELIARLAYWLYAFDGSPGVPVAYTGQQEEVYRTRATQLLGIVLDNEKENR